MKLRPLSPKAFLGTLYPEHAVILETPQPSLPSNLFQDARVKAIAYSTFRDFVASNHIAFGCLHLSFSPFPFRTDTWPRAAFDPPARTLAPAPTAVGIPPSQESSPTFH